MKNHKPTLASLFVMATLMAAVFNLQAQNGGWNTNFAANPNQNANVAVGALNGILYLAGGNPSGSTSPNGAFVAYNTANNTWTNLPSMLVATEEAPGAFLNGIFYVVGGGYCCGAFPNLQAYDPVANSWTLKSSMQTPQGYGVALAVANGLLYAIGGNSGYGTSYATVEAYDPTANNWTVKSSLPSSRSGGSVAVVNGIIYYLGGGNQNGVTASVESYNPTTDTWATNSPMPVAVAGFGTAVLNGLIYAVGGGSSTVQVYNPATDTWTTQGSLPSGLQCGDSGGNPAAVINGAIYFVCYPNPNPAGYGGTISLAAFTPSSLAINMYAGLTIVGQIGNTYEIDSCSNLAASNWIPLTTFVLSNNPFFFVDTNSTYFSHLFYRAVQQ